MTDSLLQARNERVRKEYKRARTKATEALKRIHADEYEELVDKFLRKDKLDVLPSTSYQDYIVSEEWARKRAEVFATRKSRCAICYEKEMKKLQVHHKTYCRLGAERMEDLTILCWECHKRVHDTNDRTKGENLRRTTERLIKEAKKERRKQNSQKKAVPNSVTVRKVQL